MSYRHPGRRSVTTLISEDTFAALEQFAKGECGGESVHSLAGTIIHEWLRENYDESLPELRIPSRCKFTMRGGGRCKKVFHYEGDYCTWHKAKAA